jgi:hypothetical protein
MLLRRKSRKVESMKKQLLWMTLLLTMFASAAVTTQAQATHGLRADVPFDFVVGDQTIPAGHVFVQGVSSAGAGPLAIRNFDQGQLAMRAGHPVLASENSDECKLVFRRYGTRYYLAQIYIPGYKAWEVMKSKEERSLEREMRVVKNFKASQVVAAATRL